MGDDGRLSLRQQQQGIWNEKWNNGFSDPVVEYKGVTEYDLCKWQIHRPGPMKMASEITGFNETGRDQTGSLAISYTLATSKGWKISESLKIGASFKAQATIPFINVGGELTTSVESTTVYEWNETKTTSETKTVNMSVIVPPGKSIMGMVTWRGRGRLSVPYTVKGTSTFRSGRTAPYRFSGVYEGDPINERYHEMDRGATRVVRRTTRWRRCGGCLAPQSLDATRCPPMRRLNESC